MSTLEKLRSALTNQQLFSIACAKIGNELDSTKIEGRLFHILFNNTKGKQARRLRKHLYPELREQVYPDELYLQLCILERDWIADNARYLTDIDFILESVKRPVALETLSVGHRVIW